MKNHQDTFLQRMQVLAGHIEFVKRMCSRCHNPMFPNHSTRILDIVQGTVRRLQKMSQEDKAKLNEIFGKYE